MGKVKKVDKLMEFAEKNTDAMDLAMQDMAVDIERLSKQQVPVSATKKMGNKRGGGQLQSSGRMRRLGLMHFAVIYNKEYAAYQEWGGDGKRVVRKYSTPGRKKFYLRDPGELITSRIISYVESRIKRIKI